MLNIPLVIIHLQMYKAQKVKIIFFFLSFFLFIYLFISFNIIAFIGNIMFGSFVTFAQMVGLLRLIRNTNYVAAITHKLNADHFWGVTLRHKLNVVESDSVGMLYY